MAYVQEDKDLCQISLHVISTSEQYSTTGSTWELRIASLYRSFKLDIPDVSVDFVQTFSESNSGFFRKSSCFTHNTSQVGETGAVLYQCIQPELSGYCHAPGLASLQLLARRIVRVQYIYSVFVAEMSNPMDAQTFCSLSIALISLY
jgi:hypothetical protein